jgi:hypothetical protein
MKHKYPIGAWVRFYQSQKLVVGIVNYLIVKQTWESECSYSTDLGVVSESQILEARMP